MERKESRIGITDTTLRDAPQSLWATRMHLTDILPIAERIDEVGYHSVEVWGGATFDVCMRFLNEDPWDRLYRIREKFKHTKLQMLLRGQNLVAYRNFADDLLEEFVKRAVAGGIDIIRIFDALNDTRNMQKSIEVTKREGAHAQGTICYTISPVHDMDHFVETAKDTGGYGLGFHLHQGHVGHTGPVHRFRAGQAPQGDDRGAHPAPLPRLHRYGFHLLHQGPGGGGRHRRLCGRPPRPLHQPAGGREHGRLPQGHALRAGPGLQRHPRRVGILRGGRQEPQAHGGGAAPHRRHRHLPPDPGGHGHQPHRPAGAAERPRPHGGGAGGDTRRAQGHGLSAPGHPHQPAGGHPGGVQRAAGREATRSSHARSRTTSRGTTGGRRARSARS